MSDTLLIVAHPRLEQSRVSRAVLDAAQRTVGGSTSLVVRDLYALYPDYLVDVAAEQAALARASVVVWLHPLHWYGMPPLLRLWQDEVLSYGWAYGGGSALQGKRLWLVTSTGGGPESYQPQGHNRHHFEAFLPPYVQTAALCGMHWQVPAVLHGAHRVSPLELTAFATAVAAQLLAWASAPDRPADGSVPDCTVPGDCRPRDGP